jgi:hypothetical protein
MESANRIAEPLIRLVCVRYTELSCSQQKKNLNVRFRGGHRSDRPQCPLMTQSGDIGQSATGIKKAAAIHKSRRPRKVVYHQRQWR